MRAQRRIAGVSVRVWTVAGLLGAAVLAGCGDGDEAVQDGDEAVKGERGEEEPAAFGYSGAEGPSHWGSLDPAYKECSEGERQSPIALQDGETADLPRIDFSYQPADELEVENNGHSVEAAYPPGSSIAIDDKEFELEQFHYHAPGEHTLNGRPFPLEFHFVHMAEDGSVAVLGVFAEEGRANPAFSNLVGALPSEEGEQLSVEGGVNALELLPPDAATAPRWAYEGSLTTPPCAEPVRWSVFSEPIELSKEQIADYTAVYDHNNRPVQPLNDRQLLISR